MEFRPQIIPEIKLDVLFPWEDRLLKKLEGPVDSRKIFWYYDYIGGTGKSTFAKYLYAKFGPE